METEIELKFFVSPDFSTRLRDKITYFNILQQRQRELHNIYYDTHDHLFRKLDMGLRVRRYDEIYVQTLKTAGRVVAGLHQRPEYNAELTSNVPNLSLIPLDAWPSPLTPTELAPQLLPLFATDFERQQWLIGMVDGSQIEVAFDCGEVTTERGGVDELCEVEIELKAGHTDALFIFARELAQLGGLRLGNLSKAARGYRLATDYQGDAICPLLPVQLDKHMSAQQAFIQAIEHALAHWHNHEQIYVERQDPKALLEINHAAALIRQIFVLYGGLIPRRASALLRQELQWLEAELSWLQQANAIARLCEDKGYFFRKLNAQKQIKQKLDARAAALPTADTVLSLLTSTRYCNLLLDLSRWLLTQGWQPFLDDKARNKLNQPVIDFARRTLESSWQELGEVFGLNHDFDRFSYLDQQPRLMRNLLAGDCVASLFDNEKCQTFRLPWLDLLQGIEDIQFLEPIRQLMCDPDFSPEDQAQIEKWLTRKEESLLHAMQQSRQIGINLEPYWW